MVRRSISAIFSAAASILLVSVLTGQPALAFSLPRNSNNNNSNRNNVKLHSHSGSASTLDKNKPTTTRKNFLQQAAGAASLGFFSLFVPKKSRAAVEAGGTIRYGDESIMAPKEHGTSSQPVQSALLFEVNNKLADRICNFNRHFAEMGGYFQSTPLEEQVLQAKGPITFYDSVTGKPLFVAPINRSPQEFIQESKIHGWPSFRDDEVVWENVRILKNSGETVSVDGTHLGHNLPDRAGNRYCINLVSIAGRPV